MHCRAGMASRDSCTTVASSSTPTQSSERSAPLHSGARIICSPDRTKALLAAHDNLSLQIKACLQPIGGHRAAFASAISLPAYPLMAQVGMTNDPGRAFAQLARWKGTGIDHATDRRWADG